MVKCVSDFCVSDFSSAFIRCHFRCHSRPRRALPEFVRRLLANSAYQPAQSNLAQPICPINMLNAWKSLPSASPLKC